LSETSINDKSKMQNKSSIDIQKASSDVFIGPSSLFKMNSHNFLGNKDTNAKNNLAQSQLQV